MNLNSIKKAAGEFYFTVQDKGVRVALQKSRERILSLLNPEKSPLERVNPSMLFSVDESGLRREERRQIKTTGMIFNASNIEKVYPNVFQKDNLFMRYALFSASEECRGLVIYFHGHDAFLHMGSMRPWKHFDVLAPWDTFGYNRQGSWFWGEKGRGFVENLTQSLIKEIRKKYPDKSWFCAGASMGGWASLYHGIKYGCSGIYVGCPQVDLRLKVMEYGKDNRNNPYGYLVGDTIETVPDLFSTAENVESLPPLFLVQNQYDAVNRFAEHGYRLLNIYNKKHGWYGLRIHPAIGHLGDFETAEADYLFSLIISKNPPRSFPMA